MPSINNILNNNFSENATIRKILDINTERNELEKSIEGTTAPRYTDLAELQESGKSNIFNQSLNDLVMSEVYKSTYTSTNSKLINEGNALDRVRGIIQQLNDDLMEVGKGLNIVTRDQICNKALEQISLVLNTVDDEGYVFGGINNKVPPCNVNLTTTTNVDAVGNMLNNYTDSVPNVKTITISKNNSIKIGIDAGNPAFSSLIGTINKLKALPSISNPDVDLLPFRNDIDNVVLKFESLIATNLNNKAALTESRETNADNLKQATDVLNSSDFLKSPDEVIQGLLDSSRSLRILELVQSLNNRDFQSLISSYA